MDVFILDYSFQVVDTVDNFISIIWTDRYNEAGDFQMQIPASEHIIHDIQLGFYVSCEWSDRTMIIENVQVETSIEKGAFVTFSGRSLESILERRVVWGYYVYVGSMQEGLKRIITKNIISPEDTHRKIDGFQFYEATDTEITDIEHEFAVIGDDIYTLVSDICKANDIGFKIILSGTHFVFSLYIGENRSFSQEDLSWVAFSPMFDNMISSRYVKTDTDYRTVSMVAGERATEDDESSREIVEATLNDGAQESLKKRRWGWNDNAEETYTGGIGLNRREMYTDASSISKTYTDDEGTEHTLTDDQYQKQLLDKGREDLTDKLITQSFEGETDYQGSFAYNKDYWLGDILQLENEYGLSCEVRVEEVICTLDDTGLTIIPGFTAL